MSLAKHSKSLDYFKSHADELVEQVAQTHQPCLLTQNGQGVVVVQSAEDYQHTQERLALMQIQLSGDKEIAQGKTQPMRSALREIGEKYGINLPS